MNIERLKEMQRPRLGVGTSVERVARRLTASIGQSKR